MTHVEIEEQVGASAEAVWDCFLGSRGEELAMAIYAESVETVGQGVGSIRTTQLKEGAGVIRERIDEFDEENFFCGYSVIDRGPMPFADYKGQIKITPSGPGACIVKLQADYTPEGVPEQDSIDLYMQNNHGAISAMKEMLGV